MIMDTLPYLLLLVRKNILLHALVINGSYHGVNLDKYKHEILGSVLMIKNLSLSNNDKFNIDFDVKKDLSSSNDGKITSITLNTTEGKYFDDAQYYFNYDENYGKNKHPIIKERAKFKKDLGIFRIFDDHHVPPAFVSIQRNPTYGYAIFINFYSDFDETYKRKKFVDDAFEKESN